MIVTFKTNLGLIKIELDAKNAPKTTKNFTDYVKKGHYDGTIFHRVIDDFMIQGGGMDANMVEQPVENPIQNEANNGLTNQRGSVAMARTNDPHSATAQFFINLSNNTFLNFRSEQDDQWGYAVFGQVTEGMEVVDTIRAVKTGSKGFHSDVPIEPITIISATVDAE